MHPHAVPHEGASRGSMTFDDGAYPFVTASGVEAGAVLAAGAAVPAAGGPVGVPVIDGGAASIFANTAGDGAGTWTATGASGGSGAGTAASFGSAGGTSTATVLVGWAARGGQVK